MTAPVSFLHLTDLHIGDPAVADEQILSDTLATLDAVVARIAAMMQPPAFVVVSGDLTQRGDAASYRLVADRLGRIAAPKVLALGNHDARGPFRQVMLGGSGEAAYAHDLVLAGVHLIVLDSLVPGRIAGGLDAAQFGFLAGALDRHEGLPKIVVVHHPPALEAAAEITWHSLNWADSERLCAMLAGRVAGMLCGHVHLPRVIHWHGLPVVVGNGLHNTIDPLVGEGMRIIDATGFGLCTLRPSGLQVDFVTLPHGDREIGRLSPDLVRSFR